MDNIAHTPAYKIFHYKFNFEIPALHFYSAEYQSSLGVTSTGDKAMDRTMMNSPVGTRGTIMEMANYYDEEVPITLTDPRDAVPIYEIVKAHLANWVYAAQREHNLSDIPVDDLRKLDEFAISIYQIARRYKPEIKEGSKFLQRTARLGSGLDRNGAPSDKPKEDKKDLKPAEHHPVIDTIEDHLTRRNIKWS